MITNDPQTMQNTVKILFPLYPLVAFLGRYAHKHNMSTPVLARKLGMSMDEFKEEYSADIPSEKLIQRCLTRLNLNQMERKQIRQAIEEIPQDRESCDRIVQMCKSENSDLSMI